MNAKARIDESDRHNFIESCEVSDCSHSLMEHVSMLSSPVAIPEDIATAHAAVVEGNIMAFTEGMSRQNREDVMDAFLFATLVANKAFNQQTDVQDWYRKFFQVLSYAGFGSRRWDYAQYRATQKNFSMDQVGLEIISSILVAAALPGPASLAMLKVAGDAVNALKASEKPLRLFERQTKLHRGGSFRIASCNEDRDGTVSVALGAVHFAARSAVTNVLFWEWNNAEVETHRGEDLLFFNSRHYEKVREAIQDKLGNSAKTAIEEFEI